MLQVAGRYLFTLVALQGVMGGFAFLLANWWWLSAPMGLLFLGLVWRVGYCFGREPASSRGRNGLLIIVVGILWQLPGLQGTFRFFTDRIGWSRYDGMTDLQDFAMVSWHTILLPLLALMPSGLVAGYYARYYMLLLLASPFLVILVATAGFYGGKYNFAREGQ